MHQYSYVKVESAPITTRYWYEGCEAKLDHTTNQIMCGGAWFDFDSRWVVSPIVPSINN